MATKDIVKVSGKIKRIYFKELTQEEIYQYNRTRRS